jgi:hypothetical protein
MNAVIELRKAMEKQGSWIQTGMANPNNADSIERLLGSRLPDHYREFLNTYGYLEWFGDIVFGATHEGMDPDEVSEACVVTRTNKYRSLTPQVGFDFVAVVATDHRGGFYYLKSSDDGIFRFEHETNETQRVCQSTNDLIKHLSRHVVA